MQKSLIEKWKNNTMDEVDKEMFRANLRVAANKITDAFQAIIDAMEQYPDELKIMGICVSLRAGSLYSKSPIGSCRMYVGDKNKLMSWAKELQEELEKNDG